MLGGEDRGYEDVERALDVQWMLARLSPRDAMIVRLRFVQDMVQREIAAVTGLSQMQVSRVLSQAVVPARQAWWGQPLVQVASRP